MEIVDTTEENERDEDSDAGDDEAFTPLGCHVGCVLQAEVL